ncbi:MAG: GNAT family N-acetyltransferase [Muribaculaceae bacterium]|nr:GNAT family N-acetyltransferase [Muribaculaceae bacterium]
MKRIKDIGELMKWREEVIGTVFGMDPSSELLEANRKYYEKHIPDGSHIAFIAESDGREVGSGSICITEELPSPDNPTGLCAYLMNIYVREGYREHGIGHAIVRKLLEEARRLKCEKIYLETTEAGRGVYESLGFRDMPDMMKYGE